LSKHQEPAYLPRVPARAGTVKDASRRKRGAKRHP